MKRKVKQPNFEEIKMRFYNKGLYLLSEKCLSSKDKLKCVDKEGYYYSINYNNLSSGKFPERFNKFNPYVIKNIQKYLDNCSEGTQIVSTDFRGSKELLEFICPCCNQNFHRTWDDVYVRHRFLCQNCTKKNSEGNGYKYSLDYVREKLKEHGYKMLDDSYIKNDAKISCINSDGYRVKIKFTNFSSETIKREPEIFSPKFNGENFIYNVNQYFYNNNIDCKALYFDYDEKKYNNRAIIYCECECGNVFPTNMGAIKRGQVRCSHCSSVYSNIENKVGKWLDKKHIVYERQKKFEQCKDKRCLPFDFYLPKYNMCIEVDGRQHDHVEFFNKYSEEEALEKFETTKKHDLIKTQFCLENNIELFRIKEIDIQRSEKYKELLYNKLIKK